MRYVEAMYVWSRPCTLRSTSITDARALTPTACSVRRSAGWVGARREEWVRYALAMIVGRVVYQGSKLALTNLWEDTALWSLCGLGEDRPEGDECYEAMDR